MSFLAGKLLLRDQRLRLSLAMFVVSYNPGHTYDVLAMHVVSNSLASKLLAVPTRLGSNSC